MNNETLTVEIVRLNDNSVIPTRAHVLDAGIDLYASEDMFIKIGDTVVVNTGISISLPKGTFGKIEDRSSLASQGLRTGGGVVDSGYNGEVKVVIHNLNNDSNSTYRGRGYQIKKGERIAQMIVHPVLPIRLLQTEKAEVSERGIGGFGSSGR